MQLYHYNSLLYLEKREPIMRKKVLLLHGWGGSNYPHWQSVLAAELAKNYNTVSFFKFSNFNEPHLEVWKRELKAHLQDFKPDIVICHSLANTLWFHLCNETSLTEVEKLYLVAPPSLNSSIQELREFFPLITPENLYAKETLLICSNNDPYMREEEAYKLQEELQIPIKILKNAGHINSESGFGKWEWMLKRIEQDLAN